MAYLITCMSGLLLKWLRQSHDKTNELNLLIGKHHILFHTSGKKIKYMERKEINMERNSHWSFGQCFIKIKIHEKTKKTSICPMISRRIVKTCSLF